MGGASNLICMNFTINTYVLQILKIMTVSSVRSSVQATNLLQARSTSRNIPEGSIVKISEIIYEIQCILKQYTDETNVVKGVSEFL